jgi:hypothetical protein
MGSKLLSKAIEWMHIFTVVNSIYSAGKPEAEDKNIDNIAAFNPCPNYAFLRAHIPTFSVL